MRHRMISPKTVLMGSVAAMALSFAMAPNQAAAFDEVDWTWDKRVRDVHVKDVRVEVRNTPSGNVNVEAFQTFFGDVGASSVVTGIVNDQPDEGGSVDLEGTFSFFQEGYDNTDGDLSNGEEFGTDEGGSVSGQTGDLAGADIGVDGHVNETAESVEFTASVEADDIEVEGDQTFDARTELPTINSAATAVANNMTVDSDVATDAHIGQVAAGDGAELPGPPAGVTSEGPGDPLSSALLLVLAGPSNISANSTVAAIENARVDSSATAVANNASVDVDAENPHDAIVGVDSTQIAVANVSASSSVSGVSVSNYTDLGRIDPLVDSTATAVGNNLTVDVSSPNAADHTPADLGDD